MLKWGLISQVDAAVLMKTADLICEQFATESIEFTEVGIYSGLSGNALTQYFTSKKVASWWIGVDNFKDNEKLIYTPDKLIIGNSNEVHNKLEDDSQHLIFIDGDHSLIGVISDFFAYESKVKVGGYLAFHDTGKHIKPFKDFQHGDKNNPDAYISVRKALNNLGLFHYENEPYEKYAYRRWDLIFDEADLADEAGGICCFRKLY